ncbi:hypothetical protein R3P38DRAFT_3170597 [Favolaschia claudopus]|uniref:Uncharacterized protein n=1 Tax=Favolaschia claudopus TaxID=2862362 RepID=A0AAW0DUA7_9AGAR
MPKYRSLRLITSPTNIAALHAYSLPLLFALHEGHEDDFGVLCTSDEPHIQLKVRVLSLPPSHLSQSRPSSAIFNLNLRTCNLLDLPTTIPPCIGDELRWLRIPPPPSLPLHRQLSNPHPRPAVPAPPTTSPIQPDVWLITRSQRQLSTGLLPPALRLRPAVWLRSQATVRSPFPTPDPIRAGEERASLRLAGGRADERPISLKVGDGVRSALP